MALLAGVAVEVPRALRFPVGGNSGVLLPNIPALDGQTAVSLIARVRVGDVAGTRYVFGKRNPSGGAGAQILLRTNNTPAWQFLHTGGTNQNFVTNTLPPVVGRWVWVAVSSVFGSSCHIYLGSDRQPLIEAGYATSTLGSSPDLDVGQVWRIGNRPADTTGAFGGDQERVQIYGRALSLAELREIQASGMEAAGCQFDGLLGADGAGARVPDISGRNVHGTMSLALPVEGPPFRRRWWRGAEWLALSPGSALVKLVSETVEGQEAGARLLGLRRAIAETVETQEAVARVLALLRARTETVEGQEAAARLLGLLRARGETVEAQEAVARLLGLRRSRSETVEGQETVARVLALLRARTETVEGRETVARVLGFIRIRSETVELTEAEAYRLGILRVRSETVEGREAVARVLGFIRSRTETVEAQETGARLLGLRRVRGEVVALSEVPARTLALLRVRAETVELRELLVRRLGVVRVRGETVELLEAVAPIRGFVMVRGESMSLIEGRVATVAAALFGFLLSALSLVPILKGRIATGPGMEGQGSTEPGLRGSARLKRDGAP